METSNHQRNHLVDCLAAIERELTALQEVVHFRAAQLSAGNDDNDTLTAWAARAGLSKATLTRLAQGQALKADTLIRAGRAMTTAQENGTILSAENADLAFATGRAMLGWHPIVADVIEPILDRPSRTIRHEDFDRWQSSGAWDRLVVIRCDYPKYRVIHKGTGLLYRRLPNECEWTLEQATYWRRLQVLRAEKSLHNGEPIFLTQRIRVVSSDRPVMRNNFVATIASHSEEDRKLYYLTVSEPVRPGRGEPTDAAIGKRLVGDGAFV